MIRSTFAGFTTAQLGMAASQRALDVAGQNIANQTPEKQAGYGGRSEIRQNGKRFGNAHLNGMICESKSIGDKSQYNIEGGNHGCLCHCSYRKGMDDSERNRLVARLFFHVLLSPLVLFNRTVCGPVRQEGLELTLYLGKTSTL